VEDELIDEELADELGADVPDVEDDALEEEEALDALEETEELDELDVLLPPLPRLRSDKSISEQLEAIATGTHRPRRCQRLGGELLGTSTPTS
jgi:hypothetical protein